MRKRLTVSIKKAVKRILHAVGLRGDSIRFDPNGVRYYEVNDGEEKNAGFQSYYLENYERIKEGQVPDRYRQISSIVPGQSILELGSADGVQSLVFSLTKERVIGVELMPMQYQAAMNLREQWMKNGLNVSNCEFVNQDIMSSEALFKGFDTIFMSRVIYHLRDQIDPLLAMVRQSDVKNVVLVGCPVREKNWREGGDTGDPMGRYAYYASKEGMEELLRRNGFSISQVHESNEDHDPIVIGTR